MSRVPTCHPFGNCFGRPAEWFSLRRGKKGGSGGSSRSAAPAAPAAPSPMTLQLTADQKDIDSDRADLAKAQKRCSTHDGTVKLNADFEKSQDVIDAKKATADANAQQQQTARDTATASLAKNPAYAAAAARNRPTKPPSTLLRDQRRPLRKTSPTKLRRFSPTAASPANWKHAALECRPRLHRRPAKSHRRHQSPRRSPLQIQGHPPRSRSRPSDPSSSPVTTPKPNSPPLKPNSPPTVAAASSRPPADDRIPTEPRP